MRAFAFLTFLTFCLVPIACDDGPTDPPEDAGADGDAEEPDCVRDEDCDDDVDCTTEYCESGRCRRTSDHSLCDDGLRCNGVESCRGADGCVAGDPIVCEDGVECTDDVCDADSQRCESTPNDDACPGGYLCDPALGGCVPRE